MGRHIPADQIETEYVSAMGADLGRLFAKLFNECVWLHVKWAEYVILFGTKPQRVALLNASASSFFGTIEDALWENVLLHLARLTDPPLTAGKANLTLARLPALVDQQIAVEVTQLWDEVVAATQFGRDWRNRRIAHTDLALRFNQSAAPLTPASRADVSKALTAIATLLNRVESHYRGSTVVYDAPGPFGGAERFAVRPA